MELKCFFVERVEKKIVNFLSITELYKIFFNKNKLLFYILEFDLGLLMLLF